MVNLIKQAIEALYQDKCWVYAFENVVDGASGETTQQRVEVVSAQPCRISFSSVKAASVADPVASVSQSVKLFISPDVDVKAGSRIDVVRSCGAMYHFKSSGMPAIYTGHQEIMLTPVDSYA